MESISTMNYRNNYHPHPYHHPTNYIPPGNPPNYFHTSPPMMSNNICPIVNPMPSQNLGSYQTLPPYPTFWHNNPPSYFNPGVNTSLYSNPTNSISHLHNGIPPTQNMIHDKMEETMQNVILFGETRFVVIGRGHFIIRKIIGEGENVERELNRD